MPNENKPQVQSPSWSSSHLSVETGKSEEVTTKGEDSCTESLMTNFASKPIAENVRQSTPAFRSPVSGCNEVQTIQSPKPLPPSRSGFHGASLLAAFHKEYPPDLPEPPENDEEKVDVVEDRKCKEKESPRLHHSRLYHAATALCHLLVLTDTDDQNRFLYSLNSSLLLQGGQRLPAAPGPTSTGAAPEALPSPPTFELTVLKGSIKTHVWSMAARYDDEYLLEVRHLPHLQLHQRVPSSSSQQQVGVKEKEKEWSAEVNYSGPDPDEDPVDLLWTMSGFELHTSRVGFGVVSWTNMTALHYFLCTQTVPHVAASVCALGVTAFSRLFSKVLLGLPMRETLGSYFKPMPATLM